MPSTDRKLELKAKTSVAQTGSQPFVYAKGLSGSSGSWRGLWGLDGVGSGWEQVAGTCEYGKEPSGSIY
jgi:hypothetical protein